VKNIGREATVETQAAYEVHPKSMPTWYDIYAPGRYPDLEDVRFFASVYHDMQRNILFKGVQYDPALLRALAVFAGE
jgi:hypothetical protein